MRDRPFTLLTGAIFALGIGAGALAQLVPDPGNWSLDALCDGSAARPALRELLDACHAAAWRLSDEVSLRYFTHTHEAGESLGA